ncbi:four-carbon acid sugar kinase family protein [Gracilibacillus alcaliphilus]|uniref:four-carbon acid sugar kinase family protein n=1 Tax=Gracilibacillus alcaliphilus TaxID=1401441 RepID=UPI00195D484A|nr:four-carbon acid sugar kinase family protein [Gracilibacillus alcaliphilus]MBM7677560.1 uncharacterized protein YgbK (DUF1537 family) [Gracilibacillus alcaliphilus]
MFGVIADDITGANDIGIMFSKSGYIADIYSYHADVLREILAEQPDVLIFDTDSRLDHAETAYQKVYKATKDIQQAGAKQFYNKTCSVFRGNIGAEFDAMLDALKEEFAIVVLGFPQNGRTTVDSTHYVYGVKLEDSQFNRDPIHPMTQSDLVSILQQQTSRKVGAITHDVIKLGAAAIKQQIQQIKRNKRFHYVILDVTEQKDLAEIAKAIHQEKVICGSSALAEEIPKAVGKQVYPVNHLPLPKMIPNKGLFCVAGSLTPQTFKQIEYMKRNNHRVLTLDTLLFITRNDKEAFIQQLQAQIIDKIQSGSHVILHSSNTADQVEQTKQAGAKLGWSNTEISRFVSETMANITAAVIRQTGQYRLVVAGGDTSATVCKVLGIGGMRVWKEIQPGLPSCLSHTSPPYLLVLKSGSFGDEAFIEKAFDHLSR